MEIVAESTRAGKSQITRAGPEINWRYAQAPDHADSAGWYASRRVWLDLDREAVVEITSEEKEYPVEAALVAGETRGWRAAVSGAQTIRLIFDEPQRLARISLVFEETELRVHSSLLNIVLHD